MSSTRSSTEGDLHLAHLPIEDLLDGPTPVSSPLDGRTLAGSRTPSIKVKDLECGFNAVIINEETPGAAGAGAGEPNFPEGGWRAYLAVTGATLVMATTFGLSNSFGVLQAHLRAHQLKDTSLAAVSLLGSLHLGIVFSSSLLSGIAFDKGFYQYQLALGSTLWLAGVFALSFCRQYWQFLLTYSLCLGIALGSFFSPTLSVCATYFSRRRSLMLGIAAAGTAAGSIGISILLENTFETLGFARAIRALGYAMLGLLVIANVITRPRAMPPRPSIPLMRGLVKVAQDPLVYVINCGVLGVILATFLVLFYVVTFAKTQTSASEGLTRYALTIINGTAIFSRILSGIAADRYGVCNAIIPASTLLAATTFGLIGSTSASGLTAFLVFFGIAQGAVISTAAGAFFSLTEDPSELGVRGGFGFLHVAIAALIGSPIAGALLNAAGGSYVPPLCFGGAMATLGVCLLVVGRRGVQRRKEARMGVKTWRV